jgi:hypothetical protein
MKTIAQINSPVNDRGVREIWVWDQTRWAWRQVDKLPVRVGFLVIEGQPGYWLEDLPALKDEAQQ